MRKRTKGILLALIILLVIIVITVRPRVRDNETIMAGLWTADPAFLKKSGLNEMYMYLAPREQGQRQGYLVMVNEAGDFLSNQGFDMSYGLGTAPRRWWDAAKAQMERGNHRYTISGARFTYDDDNFGGEDGIMPNKMSVTLRPLDGSLTLHDGEHVYGFFYRDGQLSVAGNSEYLA